MAKQNRQAHAEAKAPAKNWLVAGIFGGMLVVVAAVMFLSNQRPAFEPLVTGAARAEIDTMEIDHGTVKFEQPVESVFRIRNIGDEPLRIASDPRVELIEGCWPPRAVVGSTTLQPGEETIVSLRYTMHEGMGGQHEFRVHVLTNDPTQERIVLISRSLWAP